MRRQPSPSHRPGHAKLIEPFRIVIRDPPRKDMPLPCIRRNFEALELLQNLKHASFARSLRPRRNMLPLHEPAHERCRRNRLDLPPQSADR